jgi:hypothetical protein
MCACLQESFGTFKATIFKQIIYESDGYDFPQYFEK